VQPNWVSIPGDEFLDLQTFHLLNDKSGSDAAKRKYRSQSFAQAASSDWTNSGNSAISLFGFPGFFHWSYTATKILRMLLSPAVSFISTACAFFW
jgi:hypothetical protein